MERKIKKKKCKICKEEYTPGSTTQVVCSWPCALKLNEQKKEKEIRKWQRKKRTEMMTPSQWKNKLQVLFNTWIRLRDQGKECISCQRPLGKRYDAGHLYSVGRFPEMRFNPLNCHGQCVHCNRDLHGNGSEYRKHITRRIGEEGLQELDSQVGKMNHYTIPEIQEMIQEYKAKIKEMKKK